MTISMARPSGSCWPRTRIGPCPKITGDGSIAAGAGQSLSPPHLNATFSNMQQVKRSSSRWIAILTFISGAAVIVPSMIALGATLIGVLIFVIQAS
jgi:hypothetical protein